MNAINDALRALDAAERGELERLLKEVEPGEFQNYMEKAMAHVREAEEAAAFNPNVPVVQAHEIMNVLYKVEKAWDSFSPEEQKLLCAAIRYFARSYDEVADFESEIGLDDDIEVLNACLKAVDREGFGIKSR